MRLSAQALQHAAAGDGVAVDRGDHGLRKEEHRVVEPVQRRQEAAHVGRAALAQPQQIDAGGEHPRPARSAPPPWCPTPRSASNCAAIASQNSMSSALALPWTIFTMAMPPRWLEFDHAVPRGGAERHGRTASRRQPLGVDDGDGQHRDAGDLVQQRERQRRLMQQRDDADAGLQGDGAGQRQRAVEHRAAAPGADRRRRDAAPPRSTARRPPCGDRTAPSACSRTGCATPGYRTTAARPTGSARRRSAARC